MKDGKADRTYWPSIRAQLEEADVPVSPATFATLLHPFYERERYNEMKVGRLYKFLDQPREEAFEEENVIANEFCLKDRPRWLVTILIVDVALKT